MYYPVSDEALEALVCLFKRFVFPEKTTIIHAGKQDRKVYFIEKGITRSFVLHNGKQITTFPKKEMPLVAHGTYIATKLVLNM